VKQLPAEQPNAVPTSNTNSKRSLNRCFRGREDLPLPQFLAQLQMIFLSKPSIIPHAGRSIVLPSPAIPHASNGGLSLKLHPQKGCERGEPALSRLLLEPQPLLRARPFPESDQLIQLMEKNENIYSGGGLEGLLI